MKTDDGQPIPESTQHYFEHRGESLERSRIPEEFRSAPAEATEKQLTFIRSLMEERMLGPGDSKRAEAETRLAAGLSKKAASGWIERLLELPRLPRERQVSSRVEVRYEEIKTDAGNRRIGVITVPNAPHEVPAGRYALDTPGPEFINDVTFFKVWVGSRGGWAVWVQVSDDADHHKPEFRIQLDIIRRIAEDPSAASARYGIEFERCGICGRGLTNDESRARGIGPVCASRWGW